MKKLAVQMDPISSINFDTDSTVCLMQEALSRGFEIWYYTPKDLYLKNGSLYANVSKVLNSKIELGQSKSVLLESFDLLFMRNDPPVNMSYITATYLLENIADKVLILNNPTAVRNIPEKIFALNNFSEFMPPTLVTEDSNIAESFLNEHEEIVLKPLYGFGGHDIFKCTKNDILSFQKCFEQVLEHSEAPVMLQKFLPSIREGDKRILLLDGKSIGAINRIPQGDSIKANLVMGGVATQTTITTREEEICRRVGDELNKNGVIFAGLDVIGGFLTEINITSPTGIRSVNRLYNLSGGERIESQILDSILVKLSNRSL